MARIRLILNDQESVLDLGERPDIESLLKSLSINKEGVAVCVNGDIIRKAEYSSFVLKEGDRVDIITMVGGG